MDRHDHRIRKGARGLTGVIRVHGEMEGPQHGVDVADGLCAQRGAGEFLEFHTPELVGAGAVEGRISEPPKTINFNEGGGRRSG